MEGQKDRFGELDLIRFFAAVSVLIYHYKTKYIESLGANPSLADLIYSITKFGYLGVDLFFIISGFVIFASALDRTAFQFAVSRITRLYPTLWVCVSITAISSLLLRGIDSKITVTQWLANLTLFNRRLGIEDIDGVYWTLEVEIKFYFCILVLVTCGLIRHYKLWIPAWLAATASFLVLKQPFFMGWFISPEYSSYFIAGIIFYLIRKDGFRFFHAAILAPAMVISSVHAYRMISSFSKNVSEEDRFIAVGIVWCLYALFFIIATKKFTVRSSATVAAIGGTTYPLYLLHNRMGKEMYDAFSGTISPLCLILLIAALIHLASWLIHRYLERSIADRIKQYLFTLSTRLSLSRSKTRA